MYTPGRLTYRRIIPMKIDLPVYHIQIETILLQWSVTQLGSNEEKTGGQKSRSTVPLGNC